MRNPVEPLTPEAVKAVEPARAATARQGTASSRSFAELLAEAEAVRDYVVLSHRQGGPGGGLPGMLHGAWMMLAHRIPGRGNPTRKNGSPRASARAGE